MRFKFNPKKSAQAAGVLLKLNGGEMDKYIFIKMLYLADREALKRWEEPITGDRTASMQYGPILSTIYDLTKGDCSDLRAEWEGFISDADEEHRIVLKADPGVDELCGAEVKILQAVHGQFKNYSFGQMRDYCRRNLPEHANVPKGSSEPLPTEQILIALGRSADDIRDADVRQREIQMAEVLLGH